MIPGEKNDKAGNNRNTLIANTMMTRIPITYSGNELPTRARTEATLSKTPSRRKAATIPSTMPAIVEMTAVISTSTIEFCKGPETREVTGSDSLSDLPKLPCKAPVSSTRTRRSGIGRDQAGGVRLRAVRAWRHAPELRSRHRQEGYVWRSREGSLRRTR